MMRRLGCEDEMDKVTRDMRNAILTSFDVDADVNVRGMCGRGDGAAADGNGSGFAIFRGSWLFRWINKLIVKASSYKISRCFKAFIGITP